MELHGNGNTCIERRRTSGAMKTAVLSLRSFVLSTKAKNEWTLRALGQELLQGDIRGNCGQENEPLVIDRARGVGLSPPTRSCRSWS